jgi:hypothetical protein
MVRGRRGSCRPTSSVAGVFFAFEIYKEVTRNLEKLTHIRGVPGAIFVNGSSSSKNRSVVVSANYRSAADYSRIRAHYDAEFAKNGWKFVAERNVIHNDRDYGGKHLFYRKGGFTADIQYVGREEQIGFTYSIGLTWGIFDVCPS